MAKSIVFLGSKPVAFECLKYLREQANSLGYSIVGVLTKENKLDSEEASIGSYCQSNKIPLLKDLDEMMALEQVDIIVSVQFHLILEQKHIDKAEEIAVNLHMAPLPEYRGCNQFSFAIIDGKEAFGTTLHKIDDGVDSGDILFEQRFPIPPEIFVHELYAMTVFHSIAMFKANLSNLMKGKYNLKAQKDLIASRGVSFHYRKEINKIKEIDLSWSEEKIHRHIRATYFPPFPAPYFKINGKKFQIKAASKK